MGERKDHIATGRNLSPEDYSRFMEKGINVDGGESGGTSPSRQGAGTGILSPRNLFLMAAEIRIASREKGSESGFLRGDKNRAKGGTRGGPSLPGGLVARPRVEPHHQGAPVTGAPPPVPLW